MDMEIGTDLSSERVVTPEDLVNHLFFPKKLPDTEEGNLASIEAELQKFTGEILSPILKQQTLPTTKSTFENWERVQGDVGTLNENLAALETGGSACLYVRSQNSTILFTKLDSQHMRIITFRSSVPNTDVTGTCGSLLVTYPETVDVVPISQFLLSQCFSDQLEILVANSCAIAMPTTLKGGELYVETREPSNPYVISDFFVNLLCPLNPNDFGEKADRGKIIFQKKLRDQVNWNNCNLPFRRSGFWMSVKVILHLSLREEMESDQEATTLYKIILLQLFNSLANRYTNWSGACGDITAQIMAKLARRAKKLLEMTTCDDQELESLKKETLKLSWLTIDEIHAYLSKKWTATVFPVDDEAPKVSLVCQTKEGWMDDCVHQMESLTQHLNSERIPDSNMATTDNLRMIDPVIDARTVSLDTLLRRYNNGLSANRQDTHLNNESIWIYHTEWFARHLLTSIQPCEKISALMIAYFNTVFNMYASVYSDPVYYSRMTITFLKFVAVLDEIAVARHPLLRDYKTGIKSEMFHSLLISDKWEMELVEALQAYFDERNGRASNGVWLQKSNINPSDFCVQYAQQNESMKYLKKIILDKMEMDVQMKREEIQKAAKECRDLHGRISRSSCSYTWSSYYEAQVHSNYCNKCSLESQLRRERISVDRYQRPLPPQDYLRDAVVFELLIPQEIAVLRDGTILLLEEILGQDDLCLSPKLKQKNIETQWMAFGELRGFPKSGHQSLIHLGSYTKDTLATHHNNVNPDVVQALESSFILENDLSCQYFRTDSKEKTPQNPFTFNVDNTTEKDAVCYKSVQFALKTERPTENETLAEQYACHQDLSLKEFKAFGSLRCAYRVQLRNLYAEIAGKTLSLDKEPVLQLIMQSVWELGPGKREIHLDFELAKNKLFAMAFLQLLQTHGEENGTNWSNPLVLVSLSVITVRILEMSDTLEVKLFASKVLQRYREIAEEWCTKLQELLVKTKDQNDSKELMSCLMKAALCSVFTFNVTAVKSLSIVIQEATDITHLLKALSRLHYLVVRENILTQNPPSKFISNLLRHARHTIPLNLEPYLHEVLTKGPLNLALHQFASSKWLNAANVSPSDIPTFTNSGGRCAVRKHAYQAVYRISSKCSKVCVDILRGTFFVDGCPPSMLPEKFIRHPLYQSFFQSSQFGVQRSSRTFTTAFPYRGHHFEFTEGDNDSLIIRQISKNNEWYELIPREFLKKHVSKDLIKNFTHWFDSNKKTLHFRRPAASDTEENIENDTEYMLVPVMSENCTDIPNKWNLCKHDGTKESSTTYLVSIKSPGFQQIVHNLEKLENSDYIHVECKEESISVRLWRHNLSFSLRKDGLLECDNYPGFYIPLSSTGGQNLGTLVGLQSGIVLEKETTAELNGKKKLFLVQHGILSILPPSEQNGNHQRVYVNKRKDEEGVHEDDAQDVNEGVHVGVPGGKKRVVSVKLRNPTYFVYEVDHTLQRLTPGKSKSAWLYLAALHAATSSPWPDPFSQLTGTEMAMWILQSAYVWSCSPYDKECTETLAQISSLSPMYKYYPSHLKVMQVVEWPKGLERNSYAAYDGYAIIAEKLVKDSRRLKNLFPKKPKVVPTENIMELCHRSYYRNLNIYNKAAHLTPQFVDVVHSKRLPINLQSCMSKQPNQNNLATLAKYRLLGTPYPTTEQVKALIMTSTPLHHLTTADELTSECLPNWLLMKFRDNWLHLYTLTLRKGEDEVEHELTFILGALLYSGEASFRQLLNLHNVSLGYQNGVVFPTPPTSLTNDCYEPLDNEFRDDVIRGDLQLGATKPPSECNFQTEREYKAALGNYNRSLQQQVTYSCRDIRSYWPRDNVSVEEFRQAVGNHHLLNSGYYNSLVHQKINQNFKIWYNNRNLKLFVDKVDEQLRSLGAGAQLILESGGFSGSLICQVVPDLADKWTNKKNNFESPVDLKSRVYKLLSTGSMELSGAWPSGLLQQRDQCVKLTERFIGIIQKMVVGGSRSNEALVKAGLHDRLAPLSLLREKFGRATDSLTKGNCVVGALAVVWTHVRRLNRIIMYTNDQEKYSVELARELASNECENWNSLENPEWLLLELELDMTIRSIQVQVARRMMEMPNGKNGTMQLNMGEGKTSVIIPMIVATLSVKKNQVCRVTVLNSIFATNFNLLGVTIGGLVNKRLYTVPCCRDFNVSSCLGKMKSSYEECLRLGGVIMTLPEYRLSFRLQMYNNFLESDKKDVGKKVYGIESWLRQHARDLVDESDEIFSVKYQLIYTTGKQQAVDGGSSRWAVCQKLLEFLAHVAPQLFTKFGSKVIEFNPTEASSNPQKFTHFRVLDDEAKPDLNELMANGILDGKVNLIGRLLTEEEKEVVKEFLISDTISEENHNKFLELESLSAEKKQVLLLVSGYLRRGILFTALKKRWRVEYGVKKATPNSTAKLMAVPFRAKDVAAERTEFGHPDIAIILTQLSYFYSGLEDNQLLQCFHILKTVITGPETVYKSWIRSIPPEMITSDIETYQGVNLQDYEQRKKRLFPILRKHRAVVNFYLENVVFPKESKQFPGKLVTNAWDLCHERCTQATTGFSGTNDTSLLLPAQISQHDLDILVETNEKMEETLKGEENQCKRSLEMGVECRTVLQFMIEDDLRVLIDAGALMLQLGNEEIAQLWLDLDKRLAGVVYFNERGEMVVKVRRFSGYRKRRKFDKDGPLALSPFKDSLEHCAVYLDDEHTRGTDVKLPTSFKACVTVGGGMRRDKLIQACMRMRKLGQGQSVHFYLSHEVHNKLLARSQNRGNITVADIISWTKDNSHRYEKDGLVYWATNARNYAKNLAAHDLYELSGKTDEEGIRLGERCGDPDAQKLLTMYGTHHQQTLVTSVVPFWFQAIPNILIDYNKDDPRDEHDQVASMVGDIEKRVLKKCKEHIPETFISYNMLDEEQEKELEPEQEVEQEKYRPSQETPLTPELHPSVQYCVTKMNGVFVMKGISRMCDIFRDTSIKYKLQTDGWSEGCFATDDFINVIEKSSNSNSGDDMDSFLKDIRFVVSFKNDTGDISLLLLSQFEVNCLITELREKRCSPETTLHMFSGRWMEGQSTFVGDPRLQLPIQRELSEDVLAPLLIAAGNLYFQNKAEQTAFAHFLGLRLRPWTTEQEKAALKEKKMSSSGFVLPSCPELREGCHFQEDTIEMVMGILRIRNPVLRDADHVVTILDTCAYLTLTEV